MASSGRAAFLTALAKAIEPQSGRVTCPLCGVGQVVFRYVGDLESREGYCVAWCDNCFKGITISRVKAPLHVEIQGFDSVSAGDAPNIELLN